MAFSMKKKLSTSGLANIDPPIKTEVLQETDLGFVSKPKEPDYKKSSNFAYIADLAIDSGKRIITKQQSQHGLGVYDLVPPDLTEEEAKSGKPVSLDQWFFKHYSQPDVQEQLSNQLKTADGKKVSVEEIKQMVEQAKKARILPGEASDRGNASVKFAIEPKTGMARSTGIGTSYEWGTGKEIGASGPMMDEELTHYSNIDAQGTYLQALLSEGKAQMESIGVMGFYDSYKKDSTGKNVLSTREMRYLNKPEETMGAFNQFRSTINHTYGKQYTIESLEEIIKKNEKAKEQYFYKAFDKAKIVKALNIIAKNEVEQDIKSNFRYA